MPITKSTKKALRQSLRRRTRNLIYKRKIKDLLKMIKKLVLAKKIEEARSLLPQVYKVLDKAAKVGVIKENAVARKKSRITTFINKSSQTNS